MTFLVLRRQVMICARCLECGRTVSEPVPYCFGWCICGGFVWLGLRAQGRA